jgi:hypothetical protein
MDDCHFGNITKLGKKKIKRALPRITDQEKFSGTQKKKKNSAARLLSLDPTRTSHLHWYHGKNTPQKFKVASNHGKRPHSRR